MAKSIKTLKPDRSLLDPNFEGYKLSLDPLPKTRTSLSTKISLRHPSDDQFSYAHAKLFALTNVLVRDPKGDGGYLLSNNSISKVIPGGGEPEIRQVWSEEKASSSSSSSSSKKDGIFNPSLSFTDDNDEDEGGKTTMAIYGDGRGMLYILKTNDETEWTEVFHDEICGKNRPFVVMDSLRKDDKLEILLLYVEERDQFEERLKDDNGKGAVNVVEWMTFKEPDDNPTLDRVRRFVFFGSCDFLSFSSFNTFTVATDKGYQVVFDSMIPVNNDEITVKPDEEEEGGEVPPFHWSQSVEDMLLWVMLPKEATKLDIKVILKPSHIVVMYKDQIKVEGKLWNILDSTSMTWTIKDGRLEINFCKANEGLIWQQFLVDKQKDGEEILDAAQIEAIQERFTEKQQQKPLPTYNVGELDSCDVPPEGSFSLLTFSGEDDKLTSQFDLKGHQWLFNPNRRAFCLRHDVDGLIWTTAEAEEFCHTGTFSALGYVQASKQQRKFTVCASDFSYAAILDRTRHVYIYKRPSNLESDLRNRKSGQHVKQIAKQYVVTLDSIEEIVGALATNSTLIISTISEVFCIKIYY